MPPLPRLLLACWIAVLIVAGIPGHAHARTEAESFGTGFSIAHADGRTVILTALHVVKGKGTVEIATGSPQQWQPAVLLAADPAHDLALLSVSADLPVLPLADWAGVAVGEDVFAIGYPLPALLGRTPKITEGLLNGLPPGDAAKELFQFSAAIHPGSSGSPLLNRHGRVVGMVQAMIAPDKFRQRFGQVPQLLNYAVNSRILAAFLRGAGLSLPEVSAAAPAGLPASTLFATAAGAIVPIRSGK